MTAGKSAATKMCLACNREYTDEVIICPQDHTTLILLQSPADWIGKTLADRYEITDIIGKGGMGVVYLGRHARMDRMVAIKMLQSELARDEVSVKRFEQEAKAASLLSHPHLITLHDFGITPSGQPFLVMEYLEGRSLLEIIKCDGPVAPQRACRIFRQAAEGLAHAHHQGIVHRDLKPSNILLIDRNGDPDFVKVLDFGLAKLMPWSGKESQHLTKTGEVFGSPIYMSPEQCMGRELRPTSDVYSLCITLYEALTGKPPFRGQTSIQTASLHMHAVPPRFDEVRKDLCLPHSLESVVLKGLQKDPTDRFQSMLELSDALQSAMNNGGSQASISSSHKRMDTTTAIPAFKNIQDNLRQLPSSSRFSIPTKLIVPILAASLVLGIGAGVAVWRKQQTPAVVSGTLYSISDDRSHIGIYTADTDKQRSFTVSEHARSVRERLKLSSVGAQVSAVTDPKSGEILALDLQNTADNQVQKDCETVDRILSAAILYQRPPEVTDHGAHIARDFGDRHFMPLRVSSQMAFHSAPDLIAARSPDAIKVQQAKGKDTTLLVTAKYYLQNDPAYWQFHLHNGTVVDVRPGSAQDARY